EAILDAEETIGQRDGVLIADVGTGSGAIAVSLASYLEYAHVIAVELSPEAAEVARRNIAKHELGDRVELVLGNGLEPLKAHAGKLTILVSNPPYIPEEDIAGLDPEVRDWEPHMALTPGSDPYVWYRRFAQEAPDLLQPGGLLAVEVGIHQATEVVRLLEESGRWTDISVHKDLGGIERAILARTKG
ncbi:MAG TPA: HemK/PrmC family methyltransferase, partial [Stenomitos sp.]